MERSSITSPSSASPSSASPVVASPVVSPDATGSSSSSPHAAAISEKAASTASSRSQGCDARRDQETSDAPALVRAASLGLLSDQVAVPDYSRADLARSIIHIGVGGFHRAHLATYVDELCRKGHTDWSIVGAGVRPDDHAMATTLRRQDYLYSLIVRGQQGTTTRVIGSIVDYIFAHPVGDDLIEVIASPATQIVSLTVTEGGYPVDDVTGEYAPDSPTAGPNSTFAITCGPPRQRRPSAHHLELRQHHVQRCGRPHGNPRRGWQTCPRVGGVDRRKRLVPEQHGRPYYPCNHERRSSLAVGNPRTQRRVARCCRTIPPVGSRGQVRRGPVATRRAGHHRYRRR
ncbi:Mannitol 2-dehydrogenase [Nymphon striatum]|nr:Mannitol 2-dehydrogenase [Nymphon striatum]